MPGFRSGVARRRGSSACCWRRTPRLEYLLPVHLEELSEHVVHGEERRGHAAARAEELAPADPELARRGSEKGVKLAEQLRKVFEEA
jgi:hypothetical protein